MDERTTRETRDPLRDAKVEGARIALKAAVAASSDSQEDLAMGDPGAGHTAIQAVEDLDPERLVELLLLTETQGDVCASCGNTCGFEETKRYLLPVHNGVEAWPESRWLCLACAYLAAEDLETLHEGATAPDPDAPVGDQLKLRLRQATRYAIDVKNAIRAVLAQDEGVVHALPSADRENLVQRIAAAVLRVQR